tara:strand:- start:3155 stop:4819 length:1665 start_codon:yes stop_codon:yes gene_type:complete
MAKVKSGLLNIGKKATKGNSLVRRTNAFIGRKIGRKGRTIAKKFADINKTTAKGKNNLLNVPKQLELPLNADTPIKKPSIARMARNEVKSFISGAADKIEQQVESFDPKKFLSKIFDGGLSKLTDFGNSLDRMANSGQLEFLERANRLATEFVEKLASGKGGGGFLRVVGNILKIAAGIGVAALAAPFVGPVLGAVATVGAITGGVVLAAKGISDFVTGKGLFKDRKEKEKKKKEEDKFAKINALLEKNLDTIAAAAAKKQIIKEEEQKLEGTSTIDSQENVMGGETLSDATISVTDDGKLVIERKSLSSDNKTIIRTKEDYEKLLEKKKEQYKGYEESGDNKRMAGTQRYIKYYEKVIALMEEQGLKALRINVKGAKDGTDGKDGEKGVRGGLGLSGSNLESSSRNINEKSQEFAFNPMMQIKNVVNNVKEFLGLGKPTEAAQKPNVPGSGFSELEVDPSKIEASTEESDLRYESSKDISKQPNKRGSDFGSGAPPSVIDMSREQGGTETSQERPSVPTMSKTGNKVPILVPIDITNIHIPYTKSVFNIVDTN